MITATRRCRLLASLLLACCAVTGAGNPVPVAQAQEAQAGPWRVANVPLDLRLRAAPGAAPGSDVLSVLGGLLPPETPPEQLLRVWPVPHLAVASGAERLEVWFGPPEAGTRVVAVDLLRTQADGDAGHRLAAENMERVYGPADVVLADTTGSGRYIEIRLDPGLDSALRSALLQRLPDPRQIRPDDIVRLARGSMRDQARLLTVDFRGLVMVREPDRLRLTLLDLRRAHGSFSLSDQPVTDQP